MQEGTGGRKERRERGWYAERCECDECRTVGVIFCSGVVRSVCSSSWLVVGGGDVVSDSGE